MGKSLATPTGFECCPGKHYQMLKERKVLKLLSFSILLLVILVILVIERNNVISNRSKKATTISSDLGQKAQARVAIPGCSTLFHTWNRLGGDPSAAPNPVNCCNDENIFCEGSSIRRVIWQNMNLKGNLDLDALDPNIEYLDLSNNRLDGDLELPNRWRDRYRLQFLNLSRNYFTRANGFNCKYFEPQWPGDRPREFECTGLRFLDLSHNNLTDFDSIYYLEYLDLSNNSLEGITPYPFAKDGVRPILNYLDVSKNKFSQLADYSGQSNIYHFDVHDNNIVQEIGRNTTIPNLSFCNLDGNDFCLEVGASIPKACGTLKACPPKKIQPWQICRRGWDECVDGFVCCVGINDLGSGTTTCRWDNAPQQPFGCATYLNRH